MELNILYATDENYAMYTGISLYSLLENNTNIEHIKIHILDNGILNDSRLKLNILAETFNREIKYWDAKKLFVELESKITMKNTQTITAYACYFMAYILNLLLFFVLLFPVMDSTLRRNTAVIGITFSLNGKSSLRYCFINILNASYFSSSLSISIYP